jgi:glycosyltransferase involved in cell wall biosynthesis
LRVGYLVNQYPRTSHSFIRREIQALESQGLEVLRYSLRPPNEALATEADRLELTRTRAVLGAGALAHAGAVLAVALRRPVAFGRATALAVRLGLRSERGLLRHVAYLAEACVLAGWLRRAGVEHVHAHFGTNSATVALLCWAVGGPRYSFTVHGPEEFDKPEFLGLGEKVRHAAFVVTISSFGRSQLFRWARHEDWPKLEVVRCGVGADLLLAAPTPVPAAPRLVCVARLSEQKGHLLLIEAAAKLAGEGLEFELLLAGDGPMRPEIEAAIAGNGLRERVRLAGLMSAEQVREAIIGSRALVLPSFAEGLPVVVMEALALGRPVVTTAIAGIPELVQPGVTGWLVPAGSSDALAAAMREALQAPTERLAEMGRAGAELVAREHDASREAAKLADLFRTAGVRGARRPTGHRAGKNSKTRRPSPYPPARNTRTSSSR